ncbi:hypothetical protein GCM10010439_14700 [Actinocorallia aurantiaca]|uniref:Multidrug efflux pump subunit AcrA (Membrane-fusion protein) n=1 Tax=Actinocorallia aurantiaca TaxID=46204 RepID=A0ABP6GGJ9_9ACTN
MAAQRRRRRLLTGVVAVALLSSGVGFAAARWIKSPAQQAADAGEPPTTLLTAKVERRVLTTTIVLRGQVAPSRTLDVSLGALSEGAAVITRLPVKIGRSVKRGTVVAEVSGRPIIVLPGKIVAYRDLRFGARGPDVVQLQAALRSIGYSVADPRGELGPGTSTAIGRLYVDRGYTAVFTEETRKCAKPKTVCKPKTVKRPYLPVGEVSYTSAFPVRVSAIRGKFGQRAEGVILQLATSDLRVRSSLSPADRDLVRVGRPVEIFSESAGRGVKGKISAIGELPSAAASLDEQAGETGPSGHPITVSGNIPQSLAGQDVRLTIIAGRTDSPVLVVPASALYGTTAGTSQVIKVGEGGGRERIDVTIGASSGGFMEVRPSGDVLREGDSVVIGK